MLRWMGVRYWSHDCRSWGRRRTSWALFPMGIIVLGKICGVEKMLPGNIVGIEKICTCSLTAAGCSSSSSSALVPSFSTRQRAPVPASRCASAIVVFLLPDDALSGRSTPKVVMILSTQDRSRPTTFGNAWSHTVPVLPCCFVGSVDEDNDGGGIIVLGSQNSR